MFEEKQEEPIEPMEPVLSQTEQTGGIYECPHDEVFGEITEGGPNYRNVGWLGTAVLMMKTQIGLGVLSIPAAFDVLGIVPGILCLVAIGTITTWSNYMVGVFKLRHREVYGVDDVGHMICGLPGRLILGGSFILWWVFSAGSGMLGISIGLNAVSSHGACTSVFVAVAAIAALSLGSIQTLGRISWVAWIGLVSILTAVLIVAVGVGVEDRPADAPIDKVWVSDYKVIGNPSFASAMAAVCTIVFAYAGTPAFFSIVSEMREPRYYTRALIICQSIVSAFYLSIGIVVYYYCGSYVSSPALGSAGPLVKKVSYGFALPGLLASTTIFIHFPAKYIFIRILQGSRHLSANTMTHWLSWFGLTSATALIAFMIASAIPVFNDLVSLIGALMGTMMAFQPMGCMWLYDNWSAGENGKTVKWNLMVAWSAFVILAGTFLMIGGTYGSIVNIISSYSGGSGVFSCADNSD